MMGNRRFEPGKKLGDIVLCAEQRLGKGTIIAFADTSSLTNGITMGSHDFNARLLGYLANRPGSPQTWWRQILGTLLGGGLLFLLLARVDTRLLVSASLVGALSLVICIDAGHSAATIYPNGPVIRVEQVLPAGRRDGDADFLLLPIPGELVVRHVPAPAR